MTFVQATAFKFLLTDEETLAALNRVLQERDILVWTKRSHCVIGRLLEVEDECFDMKRRKGRKEGRKERSHRKYL